jgi:hypothetical protein
MLCADTALLPLQRKSSSALNPYHSSVDLKVGNIEESWKEREGLPRWWGTLQWAVASREI